MDTDDFYISLISGGTFNYARPEESNITIEDIGGSLSNICRFSGHLPRFYSVAQHLVNTSRIVPREYAFDALMHDTAESATNDLPTPLKWALPIFKELETKIESAMAEKFGFNYPYPDSVKEADTTMLLLEKRFVKGDTSVWPMYENLELPILTNYENGLYTGIDLKGWQPQRAKREFLERFEELNNERIARSTAEAA